MERRSPGATLIPIIISSDKTQLTLFGSKAAYPVYMTIGNLPKDPLRKAGVEGLSLASGDGVRRRGHPIFAMHVGDYPEQVLVVGCKTGECPKCPIPPGDIGMTTDCDRPLRDFRKVLAALQTVNAGPRAFSNACRDAGIKRIQDPYWVHLPFVNVYQAITPDILHQLCQGVVKHLVAWLVAAYGAEEIDARCRRFPPNHNIRLFLKGITKLQRVTGKEHADMCRFILGLIVGIPLPDGHSSAQLVRAVHALFDFLYLAQYPAHTTDTLKLLERALQRFHDNKSIFVDLGIRAHFKIPKLHSLDHYVQCIELFGTTDNYDTQYTERLHIDFAKEAYRATNRKDEFPQMTLWLERREKILRHASYIQWRLRNRPGTQSAPQARVPPHVAAAADNPPGPAPADPQILSRIKLTRFASVKAVRLAAASQRYGATYIQDALARFVVRYRDPHATRVYIRPHWTMPVWHKIRFLLEDAQELGVMDAVQDVAHATESGAFVWSPDAVGLPESVSPML
ncbi:hypothetical protein C2E23DRAFT_863227 [Lenzites betulinus]|nr:hypothetical protein C2E23DRAFT_863227 [Lenzites betulinus]